MSAKSIQEAILPMMDKGDEIIGKVLPPALSKPLKDKKIRPMYVVAGLGAIFVLLFLFVFGQHSQCAAVNILGLTYPLYMSLKAIKSSEGSDDTQWLMYWIVYAFFNMAESITDFFYDWIPLYYTVKAGVLLWCFLPQTKGATLLFQMIDPFLSKYIDTATPSVTKKVMDDKAE